MRKVKQIDPLAHNSNDVAARVVVDLQASGMVSSKQSFGFWIYLMTDCILFATLFATLMVLRGQTAGNLSGADIFELPYILGETIILLFSSFTAGLALLSAHAKNKSTTLLWLGITGILGFVFLAMELNEFHALASQGHSWTQSAFLSSYFGLVGTHGLHILVGLIWMIGSWLYLYKKDFTGRFIQRLQLLTMFWHFLDLVWVGIFTIVYLVGVL